MFNKNVPLVECDIKNQIVLGLSQINSNSSLQKYLIGLENLIELIAITKPLKGSYLIIEKTLQSDCVDNETLLVEYVKNFGWDMLWWGKVTEDLIQYCVDKNNV